MDHIEIITMESAETDMFYLNWWQNVQKAAEQRPVSIRLYPTSLSLLFLPPTAQSSASSCVTCLFGWAGGVTAPAVPGGELHKGWLGGASQSAEQININSCFLSGEIIQASLHIFSSSFLYKLQGTLLWEILPYPSNLTETC